MLPIILDMTACGVALVGNGAAAARRLALLDAAGAREVHIFAPAPNAALTAAAGPRLSRRLPDADDLRGLRLVFLSERDAAETAALAALTRAAGALLHIEDDPARSDFALPAVLRRGDLTIAVSTGGASPGLAVALRDALGRIVGPEWRARTAEIGRLRRAWRAEGADFATLRHRTAEWLGRHPLPHACQKPAMRRSS